MANLIGNTVRFNGSSSPFNISSSRLNEILDTQFESSANDFKVTFPASVKIDRLALDSIRKAAKTAAKAIPGQFLTDSEDLFEYVVCGRLPGSSTGGTASQAAAARLAAPGDYFPQKELIRLGWAATVGQVSKRLSQSNLDHGTKFILSQEPLFALLAHFSVENDRLEVGDDDGLFNRVLFNLPKLKEPLNAEIINKAIEEERLKVSGQTGFVDFAKKRPLNFLENKLVPVILDYLEAFESGGGQIQLVVNEYFDPASSEVDPLRGTPEVRRRMTNFLVDIGLVISSTIDLSKPEGLRTAVNKYSEFLASAYLNAIRSRDDEDPLRNAYSGRSVTFTDFSKVDYFTDLEAQGVERENILAAGMLYYVMTLGDQLGIFRIADATLMAWTTGRLDIPQGETATRLYNYYRLRNDRTSLDERKMFYKQLFAVGDGEMVENLPTNNEFPQVWETLMVEVVKYVHKIERRENASDFVSKSGVIQAATMLQHNLTASSAGIVKSILPEMHAHLQEAVEILGSSEVVNQIGWGHQRNFWKVIERVSAESFNVIPNTSALRRVAVSGHKIFTFLADFDESTTSHEAFQDFVREVESFIVAQSNLGESDTAGLLPDASSSNGNGYGNGKGNGYGRDEFASNGNGHAKNDEWDF